MIWQNDKSRNGPLCSSHLAPGRNRPFYLVRFPPFFQTIRNVLKRIFLLLFQNDASLSTCIRSIFFKEAVHQSITTRSETGKRIVQAKQVFWSLPIEVQTNETNVHLGCDLLAPISKDFRLRRQMEEQSLQSYFPSENYQISVNSVSVRQRKRISDFKFQRCAKSFRATACGIRFHYFTPGEIQTGIFVQMDETTRSH